jgi:hypothetical protein
MKDTLFVQKNVFTKKIIFVYCAVLLHFSFPNLAGTKG